MRTIIKFDQFSESKKESSKDDEQDQLSNDVENVEMEIDGVKVNNGDYFIEDVLDVIIPDEKEFGNVEENLNAIGVHSDLTVRQAKRGDIIWVTALLRKKGTTSFTSPAVQGVLKVRIVDIYYGLQYLNKVINK